MTKQEFLDGKSFSIDGDWSKTTTYKYTPGGVEFGSLSREYRMYNEPERILISDSVMNLEKIGTKKIHLYTFLLGRKIVDKIRYEDMVEFISA
jgi:hypothetical protein